jgi:hypothetical protein
VRTLLRVLALLEPVTLAVLLLNLSTLRVPVVAQVVGPVHGACYLSIIVVTLLLERLPSRLRLLALVPGVGGLLVERGARSRRAPGSPT